MLTLVHLLYAHAADDLLILPHKPKSEANSLVETLTSLDRETHQCAADLTSLITDAERRQCAANTTQVITARQRSWGKIMFSLACVCPWGGRWGE